VKAPNTRLDASSSAPTQWGALLGTVAAFAYGLVRFRDPATFVAEVDRLPRLFHDFIHYYIATANSFAMGENEAGGYLYSPLLAIALMPWASLGLVVAMAVWALIQALVISLLVLRTSKLGPPGFWGGFLAASLTLLSVATLHSLKWGQVGVILAVLMLEGSLALAKGRDLSASLLIGTAIALKFYPAIVWPLAFALKRFKAAIGALVVTAFLLLLPSFMVLGVRRTRNFYRRLSASLVDNSAAAAGDANSQAVAAWLRRTFDWEAGAAVVVTGLVLGLVALVLLYLGRRKAGGASIERGVLASLFLAALVPFFVPTCWPLYFCTLPPLALLTAQEWRRRPAGFGRALILGLLAVSCLAQTFPAVDIAGGWSRYVEQGWLLVANLTVALCALATLALPPPTTASE